MPHPTERIAVTMAFVTSRGALAGRKNSCVGGSIYGHLSQIG